MGENSLADTMAVYTQFTTFHPITVPAFALLETGCHIGSENALSWGITMALNVVFSYAFGDPSIRRDFNKVLLWTAGWGAFFYTVILCRDLLVETLLEHAADVGGAGRNSAFQELVAHCPATVAAKLLPILFLISAVALVSSTFDNDRATAFLLRCGVPFALIAILSRCMVALNELRNSGRQAFTLHRLSGRVANTWSARFILLSDVVSSIFFRSLLRAHEAQSALKSKLIQSEARPVTLVSNEFMLHDIVALGCGLALVAIARLLSSKLAAGGFD
ncbi:MAG: hypothetical protein QOF41_1260 [Methylobacteriaceae bacterium]|nr:hypothetical protein [Methylobacteriaceae bacterium]